MQDTPKEKLPMQLPPSWGHGRESWNASLAVVLCSSASPDRQFVGLGLLFSNNQGLSGSNPKSGTVHCPSFNCRSRLINTTATTDVQLPSLL